MDLSQWWRSRLTPRSQVVQQTKIRAISHAVERIGGVNLGQGKCDLAPHPRVVEAAQTALRAGHHTATLHNGAPRLREAIAAKVGRDNHLVVDADHVLVTGGASGGLECICKAFIQPGDEVVILDPIFPYYARFVEDRGGICRYLKLEPPGWCIEKDRLEALVSPRTKLIMFCNPNNPTGRVFSRSELEIVGQFCQDHGVIAVVDEVYEHMVTPEIPHVSLASLPGMSEFTLTVSSASKTLLVTGWRIGWVIGHPSALAPIGFRSDETFLCAPAPLQMAVAEALEVLGPEYYQQMARDMMARRGRMAGLLCDIGLPTLPSESGYFLLADHRGLGLGSDDEIAELLIRRAGVGAVPGNTFRVNGEETGLLRFSCAVGDDAWSRADTQLRAWAARGYT